MEENTLGFNHINYALVEKTRPLMYKAMKYWGKKPHNIFRDYIEHYSKADEIVLDAFAGSGICPLEAIQTKRRAIAVDLNPISTFIIRMLVTPLYVDYFKREYYKLKNDILKFESKEGIFKTNCPKCKNKARIINIHYDGKDPFMIRYKCSCNKKNQSKKPEDSDLKLIKETEKLKIKWWCPKDKLPDSSFFDSARKHAGDHFYNLWTKRNLYSLSYIYDRIEKIENKTIKEFMKLAFISMVHLSTIMVSARREKSQRPDSGSWGRPAYLFPKRHLEQNPFVLFERAIEDKQGIIKAKEISNKLIDKKADFSQSFKTLSKKKNLFILKSNTIDLTKYIPEESIDYILTDPPYGGLIHYFDLSSLWSIWLKGKEQNKEFEMLYEEEITMDKKRDFDYYDRMLLKAFSELNKVLKTNRYMTVTFHNDSPKIFNSIIKACINSGFVLEKVLFQQNRRASESGVANPWGTAISDFYLRFRKPTKEEKKKEGLNRGNFEIMVVNFAKKIIAKRGQPTEMTYIINGIYPQLYKYGQYLETSQEEIASIMKKRIDKEFVLVESKDKKGARWWLTDKEIKSMRLKIPLSDRVEESIIETFHNKIKVSYDDILQTLFVKFPNALTPDYGDIKSLLKAYGVKTNDGRWILNPQHKNLENIHTSIIRTLAEIGKKLGFDVWCPDKKKDEKLKDICLKKLELNIDNKRLERIKKIDVIWLKNKEIKCVMEVENSTKFTEALERASNLPNQEKIKKYILFPQDKTKINLLKRKLNEPMFNDYYKKFEWEIASYKELDKVSNKRKLTQKDFEKIFSKKIIDIKEEKQTTLS